MSGASSFSGPRSPLVARGERRQTPALWAALAVSIIAARSAAGFSRNVALPSDSDVRADPMTYNPFAWNFRSQYLAGFVVCALLLAYAIYEQFEMRVEPCPMCIFQRLAFIGMGIFFLIGGLHSPGAKGRRIYAILVAICALIGAGVAINHLRLQFMPHDPMMAGCGPGLAYMLDAFPLSDAIKKAFTGSGDCGDINWMFLGLTMPAWCLIGYVILGAGALWAGFRKRV
jgi:disulfide bond formation protein DsbB